MLEYLTGPMPGRTIRNSRHSLPMETNIGRLFGTLAWGLEIIHENADRLKLWDDIDNARGSRPGPLRSQFRRRSRWSGRYLFPPAHQIKMILLLSGGDIDTIILRCGLASSTWTYRR